MRVLKDPGRADDVAQEVFERLWRDPARYDERRGELGPYLQLVARSRALDAWRADAALDRATDRLQVVSARDEAAAEDQGPAQVAERRDTSRRLRELLGLLPPRQREAIVLSYWGGLSSAEIARATRVPLGTAKSRLRLAHEKLRELWPPLLQQPRQAAVLEHPPAGLARSGSSSSRSPRSGPPRASCRSAGTARPGGGGPAAASAACRGSAA